MDLEIGMADEALRKVEQLVLQQRDRLQALHEGHEQLEAALTHLWSCQDKAALQKSSREKAGNTNGPRGGSKARASSGRSVTPLRTPVAQTPQRISPKASSSGAEVQAASAFGSVSEHRRSGGGSGNKAHTARELKLLSDSRQSRLSRSSSEATAGFRHNGPSFQEDVHGRRHNSRTHKSHFQQGFCAEDEQHHARGRRRFDQTTKDHLIGGFLVEDDGDRAGIDKYTLDHYGKRDVHVHNKEVHLYDTHWMSHDGPAA